MVSAVPYVSFSRLRLRLNVIHFTYRLVLSRGERPLLSSRKFGSSTPSVSTRKSVRWIARPSGTYEKPSKTCFDGFSIFPRLGCCPLTGQARRHLYQKYGPLGIKSQ